MMSKPSLVTEQQVLDYLDAHPEFLKTHYPAHAQKLIDATGRIAAQARKEARRLSKANKSLIEAASVNMAHWQALHHATLGFLACTDLTAFGQMVDEELPIIFSLAGARLIMPASTAIDGAEEAGFLILEDSKIAEILDAKQIYLGPAKYSGLFSTPLASMAAIALPDQLLPPIKGSVLILAGRTETSFSPDQGQTLLTNLAEIVGVALLACLESQDVTRIKG
jgi:uncharacterized protein YigA (DUF484 family)